MSNDYTHGALKLEGQRGKREKARGSGAVFRLLERLKLFRRSATSKHKRKERQRKTNGIGRQLFYFI